ncbi:glycosyltransferase [Oscillibacter valericigenes]|nr:glycosyltransferase [Oscillibacter valericigenes]
MATDKLWDTQMPLITILMAVYEPRRDWLRVQLQSLNAQTYPRLRLYIRDDCSSKIPFADIEEIVGECITAFPYTIVQNEKNLGSNGTFELLTREAMGDLFAYCDQDDEWLPEKLVVLQREMSQSGALLVCSDMFVMDGDGKTVAGSITKVRRHHVFRSGEKLAPGLLFRNFVTGCTMLMDAKTAKAAVPFCPYYVHDHYLALWCAERGYIVSILQPLIRYRIHSENQTGLMVGVYNKKSYGTVRIDTSLKRLAWLQKNFPCAGETLRAIEDGLTWVEARKSSWLHQGGMETVWKYRFFNPWVSAAELCMKYVPEWLFQWAVRLASENKV